MSSPATEKFSVDKTLKHVTYGASCMQGWRIKQEASLLCCMLSFVSNEPDFCLVKCVSPITAIVVSEPQLITTLFEDWHSVMQTIFLLSKIRSILLAMNW